MIKPLYLFGVDARIQNLVGTEEYGVYFALFNFVFLFQVINDPGIQNYNSRYIAQQPEKISYHFPRILGSKIILGLMFLAVVLLTAYLMGYDAHQLYPLFLISINFFLSTLFIYLRTNIAAVGMYRKDSFISALDKLIMVILLGYLAWWYPDKNAFNIYWLIYGQMVAYAISCIVALSILYPKIKTQWVVFSVSYLVGLVKKSAPYAFVILLVAIYLRIDGVMLERMLDDQGLEAGIYAAGYRFFEAAGMVAYLFGALLLPMYSAIIKDRKALQSLSITGLRVILLISVVSITAAIVYRNQIMAVVYTDANQYYGSILMYMMLAFGAVALSHIYGALLMAKGTMRSLNTVFTIGVIINVIMNYYLIPRYGAEGAAIATVITQYLVSLAQIYLAHVKLQLNIDFTLLAQSLLFGLLCALVIRGLSDTSMPWMISMPIGILISITLSLMMGIVNRDMIKLLISRGSIRKRSRD